MFLLSYLSPFYVIGQAIYIFILWFLLSSILTLSAYIFAIKARIDNRKKLLNSNVSPTWPHNMVNFGLLAAETCWRVWGTPANFNGFRVLAALLHGTLVVGVSRTLRR